jgi:uncharacterized protein (TIGR03067 family)
MKPKRLFAVVLIGLLAGLGLGAPVPVRPAPKDSDALKGAWTVTKAEENGRPQDDLSKAVFTFTDNVLSLKLQNEKAPVDLTFKLDPANKSIDFQPADTKEPALCIYEVKGDTLKLCIADPDRKKRPTELKSTEKGVVYIELTRSK